MANRLVLSPVLPALLLTVKVSPRRRRAADEVVQPLADGCRPCRCEVTSFRRCRDLVVVGEVNETVSLPEVHWSGR